MKRCIFVSALYLLQLVGAHNHHEHEANQQAAILQEVSPPQPDGVGAEKSARWLPFGDPYQERLVSMLPGSEMPMAPMAYDYPPQQPAYMPQAQYFQPPPPPAPYVASPVVVPVITNQEKQEQKSKDLDVGLYTGMDIPWTHIPPFSTTYKAGLGAQTPPPLMPPAAPAPYPVYYNAPAAPAMLPPFRSMQGGPYWAEQRAPSWYPRIQSLYPYPMRQQGGFGFNKADDDVKLTMHVPKDGPPGGVLVMEMKANVYRPVY